MNKLLPTPQQKLAIEVEQGPVLIIAGAGTGKTFTITQRILYLIENNIAKPEEILALTFTEKAANEMKERVEQSLPIGFPEILISTFHSFCDEFLREEAYNVGLSPTYTIMTNTDEVFFIRKFLFEFELDFFRPKGNPTKFIYEIVKHLSKLQDENITPKDYREYFEKNISKFNTDEVKKNIELVKFYEEYTKRKVEADRISFGDLILRTFNILNTRKDILEKWRNKFKYILIDEFQDTNYAQYELIKLLLGQESQEYKTQNSKPKTDNPEPTTHLSAEALAQEENPPVRRSLGAGGKPNIMVVADDDQSIYKFRGAAVSNVLQFTKDFPQAKRIVLTENRRSVQEILDASYKLIQNNNPDRLEVKEQIDKKLVEKGTNLMRLPNPVEFRNYLTVQDESEGIALEIKDMLSSSSLQNDHGQFSLSVSNDAVRYSDIAILIRSHAHSDEIVSAFKRHKIPYQFSGARKLFNRQEVKDLINFLRVVVDYTDNISLNGLIDFDIWSMTDRDIVEINILGRNSRKSIFEVLENIDQFHEVKFEKEKVKRIVEFVKKAWGLMREKQNTWQILYDFVNESGYIAALSEIDSEDSTSQDVVRDVSEEFENTIKLRNIARLFEFIDKFQKINEEATVYEFIDYVDLLLESGDSPLVENNEYEERDAVNIITVHSSKGLEFPVVFIPSCIRGRFPARSKSDAIPIPDELIKETLPEGNEHEQEERRLMYVAVTRAKYKAYLTSAHFYGEGKRKNKVSPFVVEMFDEESIKSAIESPIDLNLSMSIDGKSIEEITEKFQFGEVKYLSYSQISDYKMCPRKYKYRYVFKIPTKPSPALSYGITIHNTLNEFYKLVKFNKNSLLSFENELTLENLMKIYNEKWVSQGYINDEHEIKTKQKGESSLQKFYTEYFDMKSNPVFLEQAFNLKFDGITIRGKIDRLDVNEDGEYEIIDYKTGDKVKDIKDVNKDMQLAIYALAAEKVFDIKASKLSLLFFDEGQKVTADNTKIEKLKEEVVVEISQVSKLIAKEIFTATPGFHCKWCDFKNICKYAQI